MAGGFWAELLDPGATAPRLRTQRLLMRPPRLSDHAAWAALRRENAAALQAVEPRWPSQALSRSLFRKRVIWARQLIRQGRGLPLLLFLRDTHQLVGGLTLDHLRRGPNCSAEIGYWLGTRFWGCGLMQEAVSALLTHAEDQLGITRVEAACLTENQASRRVLERCGFKLEGVARRAIEIDGQFRDHLHYAWLSPTRARKLEDQAWPPRPR